MENTTLEFFLFEYMRSLKERSRFEKTGFKNGLDWLISQLFIQKGWLSIRTPFSIDSEQKLKSKSEGEHGVDVSFLSKNKKHLYIFVLKDEKLNNTNWTKAGFDTDIRKAASPNMKQEGLEKVQTVKIITAYNKDEDKNGIELYDNLVNEFPSQFGEQNRYKRKFERWNLTKIVEEVGSHLITPNLLPNQLTSQFRYICSQIKDFDYCSREWLNQLEPNWKNFIEAVLDDNINENKINLLALSIYILKNYWKSEEKSYAGWIDLVEWAMLALWRRYYKLSNGRKDKKLKVQIYSIWVKVYIVELNIYLAMVEQVLKTQHGLSLGNYSNDIKFVPINDSYRAFWHLGRIGLLNVAQQDYSFNNNQTNETINVNVGEICDLLVKFMYLNPSSVRPLIDLHHIELFLVWLILYQANRDNEIYIWLQRLELGLTLRRFNKSINIPFVEYSNNLDAVIEYVVTGDRPVDFCDSSSYLVLMLIEICFSLRDNEKRDDLIQRFLQGTVKAIGYDGKSLIIDENCKKEIDLLSWVPPKNWEEKLISGSLAMEGVGIATGNYERDIDAKDIPLPEQIKSFVSSVRNKFPQEAPQILPLSVCILACLKHKSPLPPEFWRSSIFPIETETENK